MYSIGDMMEITDIRIKKIKGEGNLVGYATITLDNCFVVHNIKIIDGKEGRFIAMPRRRTANGEYKDIAHPIKTDFRLKMQEDILEALVSGNAFVS